MKKRLIVSALAIITCLAAAEVALRSQPYDELEFDADRELYWKLTPSQRGFMWMAGGTRPSPPARVNSLGLRGGEIAERSADKLRILALGDSYTFGSGVTDDETFTAALERELGAQRVDVVNAGVPGYGIFQFVELLRRLAPALRPDIVIVTFPTGDILRQPFDSDAAAESHRQLRRRTLCIKRMSRVAAYIHRQMRYAYARVSGESLGNPNRVADAQFAVMWEKDQARLMEIAAVCERLPARLILMPWPQTRLAQWDPLIGDGVRRVAEQTGAIALLGLGDALAAADRSELEIAGDGHPTAAAHRIAARYAAAAILKLSTR